MTITNMTATEALDIIFDFFPAALLAKLKKQNFYQPILDGRAKTGAEIYDYLTMAQAKWQNTDYDWLAAALLPLLNRGATLQIGCGRGLLLRKLAAGKLSPLYGLDRSAVMLQAAAFNLGRQRRVHLIKARAEDFDFSQLPKMNNVIINNFWGLLSKENSRGLLENLKPCLTEKTLIFIGPYLNPKPTAAKLRAEKFLKVELNFIFSFPFFKNFSSAGYLAKIVMLNRRPYFVLKRPPLFD